VRGELYYTVAVKQGGISSRILGALLVGVICAVSLGTYPGQEPGGEVEAMYSALEEGAEAAAVVKAFTPEPRPSLGEGKVEVAAADSNTSEQALLELLDSVRTRPQPNQPPPLPDGLLEAGEAGDSSAQSPVLDELAAQDEFAALGLGDKVLPATQLAPKVSAQTDSDTPPEQLFNATPKSTKELSPDAVLDSASLNSKDPIAPKENPLLQAEPIAQSSIQVREEAPTLYLESASLAGRLLIDPGVPLDTLRIELEELMPAHGGQGRLLAAVVPDDQGVFTIEAIQPGLVALRISLWGTNRALIWVDEIELAEGEQRLDPSGCEVSLLGRLQSRQVEVLDEFGLRIEPAVCFPVEMRDHSFGTPRVQSEQVTPRIWMDRDGVELLVLAQDREPRRVRIDPDSVDAGQPLAVALKRQRMRSLELRFLDRELLEGLPAGFRLQAQLKRSNGLVFPWDQERHQGEFDAKGKLRLEPADGGQFEVHLGLLSPSGVWRPLNRLPELVEIEPASAAGGAESGAVQVLHLRGFSDSLGVPK
jgi:hypothetical protein